ncbi:MAG: PEP-CTERM sorting domain-containing protein [Candidatus Omnitrophica bacterium]|nr:PEP-CTERM sorting domain-containing protein [Candidatus Omnitrophota bacterium]
MKKLYLMAMVVSAILLAGNAFAITTANIDGADTGEWTSLIISATDPNEAGLNDNYDIFKLGMILENNGDANDGLYIGIDLFGTPTLGNYPEAGSTTPFYQTLIDINMNGIIDGNDREIFFKKVGGVNTLTVLDGAGNPVAGTPQWAMGSVIEWFIPASMFSSFPVGGFQTWTKMDNGAIAAEDLVPDSGWNTTIPEPSSMLLLGIGLIGFAGRMVKKFKV